MSTVSTWLNSAATGIGNFIKSDFGKTLVNSTLNSISKPKSGTTTQPIGNFADQPLPYASQIAFQSSPSGVVKNPQTSSGSIPTNVIYWLLGGVVAIFLFLKLKRK